MTISEQQKIFREQLSIIYPEAEARSITMIVFERILGLSTTKLSLERFRILTTDQKDQLNFVLQRLMTHEPVQYILGEAEFCGLNFKVDSSVLIPRPETEELVYWILEEINNAGAEVRILDIGTGTGCIPIVLSKKLPGAQIEACELSQKAIELAEENNHINDSSVRFFFKDILNESLAINYYDVIVSNPPYIPISEKEQMAENVINYEPHLALLVADRDALIFYKKIAEEALQSLKQNGYLFFEINERKGREVEDLLRSIGYKHVVVRKDINGKDRMIMARK